MSGGIRRPPQWVQNAVLWQLHPLTFLGAPADADANAPPVPRLLGLLPWLDHVVELGASGLLLGPVFQSSTHGYDTVDHFRIDNRLGSSDDFQKVVDVAHDRGIRVVLDGIFNHVGRGFGALLEAEGAGVESTHGRWFRRARDGSLAVFEGHEILVELNHDEPAVADYVVAVMTHWLERGVDGWRLDAAYAVPDQFWSEVCSRVSANYPDAWLFGEVIHGDYAARVRASGIHAVTQYELWKAVWSSLNDRNFFELAHALRRHDSLLDAFVPQTFVGNHDVTRIASRLSDARHLPHAVAVLMTVAGTPSIYAGDELAFEGVKENRPGGDNAIRPLFPPTPAEGATGACFRLHQELIAVRGRHPWLHASRLQVEHVSNTACVYVSASEKQRLMVLLNVADESFRYELPRGAWRPEAGDAVEGHTQQLPAHGWAVLSA